MTKSFDEYSELYSMIAHRNGPMVVKRSLRDMVQESQTYIIRYFVMLPAIDYTIARLYYLETLSQDQISALLEITQAAVSRRLKFITTRVKFLLKMPTLDPIQVREDFRFLFPEELFEFAYFFYWENAQNRVKFYIKTSQSGAANKYTKVHAFLEGIINLSDEEIMADETGDKARKKYLAMSYLEYFNYTRQKSNVITHLYKKNDSKRTDCLIVGRAVY